MRKGILAGSVAMLVIAGFFAPYFVYAQAPFQNGTQIDVEQLRQLRQRLISLLIQVIEALERQVEALLAERGASPAATPSPVGGQITVLSPNGGEQLSRGTTARIMWETSLYPPFDVKLWKGERMIEHLGTTYSYQRFYWNIPANQTLGSDYKIEVSGSGYSDKSDAPFSITASGPPTPSPLAPGEAPEIRVLYPNGGETFVKGQTILITWDGISAWPPFIIRLWKGNEMAHVIVDKKDFMSNLSPFSWTIPKTLQDGNDYRIEVYSIASFSSDTSDAAFRIVTPAPGSALPPVPEVQPMRVLYPKGGETLIKGTTVLISWDGPRSWPTGKTIKLLKGGKLFHTIVTDYFGMPPYPWTVPFVVNPPVEDDIDYQIEVDCGCTITDTGEPFEISSPEGPTSGP